MLNKLLCTALAAGTIGFGASDVLAGRDYHNGRGDRGHYDRGSRYDGHSHRGGGRSSFSFGYSNYGGGSSWGFGYSRGYGGGYGGGYSPRPYRYYAPAPVYVAPPPRVYYYSSPVYVAPAPVYTPPSYYGGGYVYDSGGYYCR